MNPALAWGLAAGLGLGLGLWSLASLAPRMKRPRLAHRVAPYLVDISPAAREALRPAPPGPLPVVQLLVEPVLARGRAVLGWALGGSELLSRRLRQSGSRLSVEAFRGQQVLWGLAGAAVGVAVAFVAGAQHVPVIAQGAMVAVFAAAGVAARDLVLQRAAKARLARLAAELPVVLEFLTLSLSAGEGIVDAVKRVAGVGRGELAAELAGVVASVNTGLPFAQTLSALSRELELPPFTRFTEQLIGALDRGTPLAEVLRAQAQDARDEAKRELLEVAGRKEIAMLIPLVFLILPVTVVFAVFPGVFVLQLGF